MLRLSDADCEALRPVPSSHALRAATLLRQRLEQATGSKASSDPTHPRYGDRVQQIVFTGQSADEATLRACLDACLLDERFAAADSNAWARLRNPFPELSVAGGSV